MGLSLSSVPLEMTGACFLRSPFRYSPQVRTVFRVRRRASGGQPAKPILLAGDTSCADAGILAQSAHSKSSIQTVPLTWLHLTKGTGRT